MGRIALAEEGLAPPQANGLGCRPHRPHFWGKATSRQRAHPERARPSVRRTGAWRRRTPASLKGARNAAKASALRGAVVKWTKELPPSGRAIVGRAPERPEWKPRAIRCAPSNGKVAKETGRVSPRCVKGFSVAVKSRFDLSRRPIGGCAVVITVTAFANRSAAFGENKKIQVCYPLNDCPDWNDHPFQEGPFG